MFQFSLIHVCICTHIVLYLYLYLISSVSSCVLEFDPAIVFVFAPVFVFVFDLLRFFLCIRIWSCTLFPLVEINISAWKPSSELSEHHPLSQHRRHRLLPPPPPPPPLLFLIIIVIVITIISSSQYHCHLHHHHIIFTISLSSSCVASEKEALSGVCWI